VLASSCIDKKRFGGWCALTSATDELEPIPSPTQLSVYQWSLGGEGPVRKHGVPGSPTGEGVSWWLGRTGHRSGYSTVREIRFGNGRIVRFWICLHPASEMGLDVTRNHHPVWMFGAIGLSDVSDIGPCLVEPGAMRHL
jgi:hypothetical protein